MTVTRRIIGSCGPFAKIVADFEPPGTPGETEIFCTATEEQIPAEYLPAVADGLREGLGEVAAEVLITGGAFHDVDSSAYAYRMAGYEAGRAALVAAGLLPESAAAELRYATWPGRKRPKRKR